MSESRRYRGKIYWRPGQTRVLTEDGRLLDLGAGHTLEACKRVALEYHYCLIVEHSSPALSREKAC